jgi:circadian clock protein KaiC
MDDSAELKPLERLPTGMRGLDAVLNGGLLKGGVYIVAGRPGAGKTILGNQICFNHTGNNERALYVTLLAETHGRMLANLQTLSFFDPARIGSSLHYLNGYLTLEKDGLPGVLKLLREGVRQHRASLLVIDGSVAAEHIAGDNVIAYKRFIQELQTWVSMIGCTVLILTSSGTGFDHEVHPAHTMVDGIFHLEMRASGLRVTRELFISKYRGGAYLEGYHPYIISDDGLVIYPRIEAQFRSPGFDGWEAPLLNTGVAALDNILSGGVGAGSTTLVYGSSGAGKTVLGAHFLTAGMTRGESALAFTFFESPPLLIGKADRLGMAWQRHFAEGRLHLLWQRAIERIPDALVHQLLDAVSRHKISRLLIDGLEAFRDSPFYRERLGGFFSALTQELRTRRVTTLLTEETRALDITQFEPLSGVSAISDNIIMMRQAEVNGQLQRAMSVLKSRDTVHDRVLYNFDIAEQGIVLGEPFVRPRMVVAEGKAAKPKAAKKAKARKSKGRR